MKRGSGIVLSLAIGIVVAGHQHDRARSRRRHRMISSRSLTARISKAGRRPIRSCGASRTA